MKSKNLSKKLHPTKSRLDIVKEKKLEFLKKRNPNQFWKNILQKNVKKKLFLAFLILVFIVICTGIGLVIYLLSYVQNLSSQLPTLESPFGLKPLTTELYDRNVSCNAEGSCDFTTGTSLYRVFGKFNSEKVNIDEIPEILKWSFIAGEDSDFYTHPGFDLTGILNCGFAFVKSREVVCGASTITAQVLKNTVFQNEPTLQRKIKEILMGTKIEQAYSKDEILQLYLTVTQYGANITGVNLASKFYFGKEPKDLTLAQAATLAAIVNDPSYLSPTIPITKDTETSRIKLKERQEYILKQILEKKDKINDQIRKNKNDTTLPDFFTEELVNSAIVEDLEFKSPVLSELKAGHFVDYVLNELKTKNYKNGNEPFTDEDLKNGGYKIITSLDYNHQKIAEEMALKGYEGYSQHNVNNTAILTINPQNGEILAMMGSRNYNGEKSACSSTDELGYGKDCKFDPQVNILTSLNEPGSTAKSLAYAVGLDKGLISGVSNIPDVPIEYENYKPKNWNGQFLGEKVSLRTAIRESRNITAIQVLELIGLNTYLDALENAGYSNVDRPNLGPSVVLGGISVKYLEHVKAYSMFANQGNVVDLNPILKILDRDGKVIYQPEIKKTKVISEQAAFIITDLLSNLSDIQPNVSSPYSCKTGTTENNIEALIVCWNKAQVTLTWSGNNNNEPLDQNTGYPYYTTIPWTREYFRRINSEIEYYKSLSKVIEQPSFVTKGYKCSESEKDCNVLHQDWSIVDKSSPTYSLKRKITVCTDQKDKLARDVDIALGYSEEVDFLRYIMPVARWQKNLDDHIKGSRDNNFPTEYCNIDRTSNGSTTGLVIKSPANFSSFTNSINLEVLSYSSSGVSNVKLLLGNSVIKEWTSSSVKEIVTIPEQYLLMNGTYEFTMQVTDKNGKINSQILNLVKGQGISESITLNVSNVSPNLDLNVGSGNFIQVSLVGVQGLSISNVELYQISNSTANFISNLSIDAQTGNYSGTWGSNITEKSSYTLFVKFKVSDQIESQTAGVNITVI